MNKQKNIEIAKLRPFEGHPYKVIDNEEMETLTESITEQGVLSPLIVRPIEDTDQYEIISGHRRFYAAQKAGLNSVPAIIFEIDKDAAAVMLVDSNLHREHILPSEKAFAYKMKLDAIKRQGERTDLTSTQLVEKLCEKENLSAEKVGNDAGESRESVRRYIRLTNLVPELLQLVDDGKIALTPGVELSYLTENEQIMLLDAISLNDCTPSLSQAVRLKKQSQTNGLTEDFIAGVMSEEKANQKEMFKMSMDEIRKYFPNNSTTEQMQKTILSLCESYHKKLMREKVREER